MKEQITIGHGEKFATFHCKNGDQYMVVLHPDGLMISRNRDGDEGEKSPPLVITVHHKDKIQIK